MPRVARTEEVRRQLEQAIRDGTFQPGERLPSERELGEMFGVSRVAIREANKGLIAIGLLEMRHGVGAFVAQRPDDAYRAAFDSWLSVHAAELIELYEVRGALESFAGRESARKADAATLAAIVEVQEAFADAVRAEAGVEELASLDVRFHELLVRAGGNQLLAGLHDELSRKYLHESRRVSLQSPDTAAQSAEDHQRIVDALGRRDGEEAAAAIYAHVDRVSGIAATRAKQA